MMEKRREDYIQHGQKMLRDPARLQAGLEYTQAIMSLGLDPDLMCWVYLPDEDRTELAIVTTMVDRVGPLHLYEMLFKAYELAATPREIDPFEVGLYSPRTALGVDLLNNIRVNELGYVDWIASEVAPHMWQLLYHIGLYETKVVAGIGIYRAKVSRRNADQDHAKWLTFRSNIERLAA